MADEYKIPIVVTADTEGAKETHEQLEKITEASKEVAEAGTESGQALSKGLDAASDAAEEVKEDLVDVAKAAEKAADTGDQIGTKLEDGLEKAAKSAEKAEENFGKVSKSASKTKESADDAGHGLKGMAEAGEKSEYGFRSTKELAEALGMVLRGDLAGGATQAGGAIEAMAVALAGGPWGVAAVALGGLVTIISLIAAAESQAEVKTEDLAKSFGNMSPKARGLAKDLLEIAKAAAQQSEKLNEAKTPADKLADAFSRATQNSEHYREVQDEIAAQTAATALAETNLAEAKGEITAEQAEAQRRAIEMNEKMRKADNAQVAAASVKRDAAALKQKALQEKETAESELANAQRTFEAKGGQLPITPDALALQLKNADEKVKQIEGRKFVGADPYGQGVREFTKRKESDLKQAKQDLENLQQLSSAYQKVEQAAENATKAREAFDVADKSAKEVNEKADRAIRSGSVAKGVAMMDAETERLKSEQAQQKKAEEQRKATEKKAIEEQKQATQNQITAIEQSLKGTEEDTAEFKKQLAEITAKKKQLVDLSDAIKAIDGELSKEDQNASQLSKQELEKQEAAREKAARERRQAREQEEGRNRMSKASDRPAPTYRQRDSSGRLIRRGKIISRAQPISSDDEPEETDFEEEFKPRINTAPRLGGALRPRMQQSGDSSNGSSDQLNNAAQGTKAAADTHSQAAQTYQQAASVLSSVASQMQQNASLTSQAIDQMASAIQTQSREMQRMWGVVNRIQTYQGGSGS